MSSVAWVLASSELGIRVTTPCAVTDRFGQPIEFVAHVHDFGGAGGTFIWHMPAPLPTARLPFGTFYFVSALNPELYVDYDRARFITLLSGLGWTGDDAPPPWYRSR